MGRQPPLRFAASVVLSGLFAVAYALSGMALRKKFWKGFAPAFVLQFLVTGVLGHYFPDAPELHQYGPDQTVHLQERIAFDGSALVASVILGYIGFVWVSISEGRRHVKAQAEKTSLENEMAAAREIQRVMVPEKIPSIAGYVIDSVYRPAAQVGGDFFQVISLRGGDTLVVIGDVSGKGLRAAMIVSMVVGMLGVVTAFTPEPAEILSELNGRLFGRMQNGFVTCLAVRLDSDGHLEIANAGHPPPYLNGIEIPFAGSMPLGMIETADYEQASLNVQPGDVVSLVTDGIAEAQNDQKILLGFPRLKSLLRQGATAIAVAETASCHGQNDDMTVINIGCQA